MRHKTLAILESGLQVPTGAAAGRLLTSDGARRQRHAHQRRGRPRRRDRH
jgi:hypothetical protein